MFICRNIAWSGAYARTHAIVTCAVLSQSVMVAVNERHRFAKSQILVRTSAMLSFSEPASLSYWDRFSVCQFVCQMSTRVSCELTEDFLQKIFIPLVCRLKRVLVGHWSAWSSRLSSANGRSADGLTTTLVSQMSSPREELTPRWNFTRGAMDLSRLWRRSARKFLTKISTQWHVITRR